MAVELYSSIILLWILPTIMVVPSIVDLLNPDSVTNTNFDDKLGKFDSAFLDFKRTKGNPSSFNYESTTSGLKQNKVRRKRNLSYAKQLLDLLITIETVLEKRYGVTEPQCQLRATCEIHRRNINGIQSVRTDRNFIKLISEMRREMKNLNKDSMARCVFEYYEEAAERGESQCNCGRVYDRCPYSVDTYTKTTKSKTNYGYSRSPYQ